MCYVNVTDDQHTLAAMFSTKSGDNPILHLAKVVVVCSVECVLFDPVPSKPHDVVGVLPCSS